MICKKNQMEPRMSNGRPKGLVYNLNNRVLNKIDLFSDLTVSHYLI